MHHLAISDEKDYKEAVRVHLLAAGAEGDNAKDGLRYMCIRMS